MPVTRVSHQCRSLSRTAAAGVLTVSVLALGAAAAHASAGSLSSVKATASARTATIITHMAKLRRKTDNDKVRPYAPALDARFFTYENRVRALNAAVQRATTVGGATTALSHLQDRWTAETDQLHAVQDAYSVVFLSTVPAGSVAKLTALVTEVRTLGVLSATQAATYQKFMTSPLRAINTSARARLAAALADDIDRPGFASRAAATSSWAAHAPRGTVTFVPAQLTSDIKLSDYAALSNQARWIGEPNLQDLGRAVTAAAQAGHTTELAAAPAVFASWTYPGPATDKVSVDPTHGTVVVTRGTAPIVLTSTLRVADGTHWQSVLPKLTWDGHAYW